MKQMIVATILCAFGLTLLSCCKKEETKQRGQRRCCKAQSEFVISK